MNTPTTQPRRPSYWKSNEEIYVLLTFRMGRAGGPEANPITARVLARLESEASK